MVQDEVKAISDFNENWSPTEELSGAFLFSGADEIVHIIEMLNANADVAVA